MHVLPQLNYTYDGYAETNQRPIPWRDWVESLPRLVRGDGAAHVPFEPPPDAMAVAMEPWMLRHTQALRHVPGSGGQTGGRPAGGGGGIGLRDPAEEDGDLDGLTEPQRIAVNV